MRARAGDRSEDAPTASGQAESRAVPEPQYSLSDENTHSTKAVFR